MESKTSGIVLKKQNFAEADRILRIFSKEFGMISAIAKGVKKTSSRKGGCLEIFCESNLRLHRRRGELFLITDASRLTTFKSENLEILKIAFSANELILNLAPVEKPLPKIYQLFREFLSLLPHTQKLQLLKIAFFAKVLNIFGFLPNLDAFEEREKKLFKFLLNSNFEEILKLHEEKEIFQKAENYLSNILENVSEKRSKVIPATMNWS